MIKYIISCLVVILFVGCSSVPITNRSRINLVPDSKVLPASFSQYEGFLKEHKLSKNAKKTAEIKAVGLRISNAVDKFMRANDMVKEADSYKWEFNLVEDKTVNAWCLPGGKVVFYTGILPMAKNTDGIAAIMGHEVAHAFAKHGQERMSAATVQQGIGTAVAYGTKNVTNADLWAKAYGMGSQIGMLKYSRLHETEADKLGMVFMIIAGYKPEESVQVWVRMKEASGKSKQPEFMSTHPSNQSRIETLTAFLPEAKRLAAKYQ